MGRFALLAMMMLAMAGCSKIELNMSKKPVFDGQQYRGKVKADRSDRQHFVSTVRPVSKSFDGAILAAEYEGVRHCIEFFGTSDITWDIGPQTNRDDLVIENDTLSFEGTCHDD